MIVGQIKLDANGALFGIKVLTSIIDFLVPNERNHAVHSIFCIVTSAVNS